MEIDKRKYRADCPFDYEDGFKRGVEWADKHPKSEMVNKQEFIEKACEIYKKHILKFNTPLREFSTTLDDAVSVFKKQLEK